MKKKCTEILLDKSDLQDEKGGYTDNNCTQTATDKVDTTQTVFTALSTSEGFHTLSAVLGTLMLLPVREAQDFADTPTLILRDDDPHLGTDGPVRLEHEDPAVNEGQFEGQFDLEFVERSGEFGRLKYDTT